MLICDVAFYILDVSNSDLKRPLDKSFSFNDKLFARAGMKLQRMYYSFFFTIAKGERRFYLLMESI